MKTNSKTIFLKAGESMGDAKGIPPCQTRPTYDVPPGRYLIQWVQTYFSLTVNLQCSSGTIGYTTSRFADGVSGWIALTAYNAGDMVTNGNFIYRCLHNHTSAALFTTDLAGGAWEPYPANDQVNSGSLSFIIENNIFTANADCLVIKEH